VLKAARLRLLAVPNFDTICMCRAGYITLAFAGLLEVKREFATIFVGLQSLRKSTVSNLLDAFRGATGNMLTGILVAGIFVLVQVMGSALKVLGSILLVALCHCIVFQRNSTWI
jgi:hypothetical protein